MRPITPLGSFVGCALLLWSTAGCGGLVGGGAGAAGDGGVDTDAPDHSHAHGDAGAGDAAAVDSTSGSMDGAANDAASCGQGVTTLAAMTANADALAVGPTGVYWSEWTRFRGMLLMLPLCGGTPVTLRSEKEERYNGIALDGTSVYATSADSILKVPLGGGTAITLAKGVLPKAIAVDGTSVYWTDTDRSMAQSVLKVPVNGGAAVTLGSLAQPGSAPAQWGPLTVGSSNVYWLGLASHTELLKVPIGGGALTTLHSAKGGRGVAVNATDVFWTDRNDGTILRIPLGGGAVTTIASKLQAPSALALDASNVYWCDHENDGSHGRVMKVPASGGTPTVIASGQALADNDTSQRLALYGASVYWLEANAVMMAPK